MEEKLRNNEILFISKETSDEKKKAMLENAFPIGSLAMGEYNPEQYGMPGRWVEKTIIWERTE